MTTTPLADIFSEWDFRTLINVVTCLLGRQYSTGVELQDTEITLSLIGSRAI